MKVAVFLLLAAMLSACAVAADLSRRADARDDHNCQSFGARPGSDAYVQCRSALLAQRRQAANDFVLKDN